MRRSTVSIAVCVLFSGAAAYAQCEPGRVPVVVPSGLTICLPANAAAIGQNPKFATQTATAAPSATPTATPADTPTATPSNTPLDTPTATPTPCGSGGASVGGFCWYFGAEGASCDTTCAAVGATCDSATITFAGSEGTDENCQSVLTALGVTADFGGSSPCPSGVGCGFLPGTVALAGRCPAPPTTCEAAEVAFGVQRACACQ